MLDEEKLNELLFPYSEIRLEQDKLIRKVGQCVRAKMNLVVHAPTGLGKTVSSIAPALAYALENDKVVFFLTSRHTQHKIALETVNLIKEKFGLKFHVSDIIGKKHMCLQEGVDLLRSNEFFDFCKSMKENNKCEFYSNCRKSATILTVKGEKLVKDIEEMSLSSSEDVKNICEEDRMCPYEIALDLAKRAKIIICDYNYVFDPDIQKSFFAKINRDLDDVIIIVDEGHNLPERTRGMRTYKLSMNIIKRALKEAKKYGFTQLFEDIYAIQDIMLILSDKLKLGDEELVSKEKFVSMILENIGDISELSDTFEKMAEAVRESQRQSYIGSIAGFLDKWPGPDVGYARIISKQKISNEETIMLSYRCLDPSLLTKKVINESHSTILMSGTLTPTSMFSNLMGFPIETIKMTLGSPFPVENRLSLVIPRTTTQYSKRSPKQFEEIANILGEVTASVSGNIAVFFPSYALLNSVYQFFYDVCQKRVFKESSQLNKNDRANLLDNFKQCKDTGAVLLACSSGSFAEGIDLPGDYLKGVVVVGLPLRVPDLETKELIKYYDAKFSKGWDYAYIQPAFSKTLQSAGRCIRSETDRGVIVFLDERYAWQRYLNYFPPDSNVKIALDYKRKIDEFFGN